MLSCTRSLMVKGAGDAVVVLKVDHGMLKFCVVRAASSARSHTIINRDAAPGIVINVSAGPGESPTLIVTGQGLNRPDWCPSLIAVGGWL